MLSVRAAALVCLAVSLAEAQPGMINTLAGGGGGDGARLAKNIAPRFVATDAFGNVFITAPLQHRVYKITPTQVITIAGTGAAPGVLENTAAASDTRATNFNLGTPHGIVVDGRGNVFFTDVALARVMRISPDGLLSVVAGTGFTTFNVPDSGMPAKSANLSRPEGVDIDTQGNLYVADSGHYRVLKITPDGWISVYAGNGSSSYNVAHEYQSALTASISPTDVAVDPNGIVYIAERSNNRVRKIAVGSIAIATVAGNGSAAYYSPDQEGKNANAVPVLPYAVDFDNEGRLLIAESENQRVRRLNQSGTIQTIVGTDSPIPGFSGDGGPALQARFNGVYDVTAASDGSLLIVDLGNNRVRRVDGSGVISTYAGNGFATFGGDGGAPNDANLSSPMDIAFAGANRVYYIADTNNNRIRSFDHSTLILRTFAGGGSGSCKTAYDNVPAISASLCFPAALTLDSQGNLYVFADTYLYRISPAGTIFRVAGDGTTGYNSSQERTAALNAKLGRVEAIAVDRTGQIFIAEGTSHRVRRIDTNGRIETIAGNGSPSQTGDGGPAVSATVYWPAGLAVDDKGTLYISSAASGLIRVVSPSGQISSIAMGGNTTGGRMTLYGGRLYVSQPSTRSVWQLDLATLAGRIVTGVGSPGYYGDGGLAIHAKLGSPSGLAVDEESHRLFVADAANERVRFIDLPVKPTIEMRLDPANPAPGQNANLDVLLGLPDGTGISDASGTVTLMYAGKTAQVTLPNVNGYATFRVGPLDAGPLTFRAVYAGDASYEPAEGTFTASIGVSSTTTMLTGSASDLVYGASLTLTANVAPAPASGSVTFYDSVSGTKTAVATVLLASGTGVAKASFNPPAGEHLYTAEFSGDSRTKPSVSPAWVVRVAKAASSLGLTVSPSPSTYGQEISFTATVSPRSDGMVEFYVNGSFVGSRVSNSGVAVYPVSTLTRGTHTIEARFAGNIYYERSQRTAQHVVNGLPTSVNLQASPTSLISGSITTLTATISPVAASGSVTFLDGNFPLFNAVVVNGVATYGAKLSSGIRNVSATYSGDTKYASSNSAPVSITVANTLPGENVSTQPVDTATGLPVAGAELTFSSITSAGATTITKVSEPAPALPANFKMGEPAQYFKIDTTAVVAGSGSEPPRIRVCLSYAGVTFQSQSAINLLHFNTSTAQWEIGENQTIDLAKSIVCADYTSLSPFAVVQAVAPVIRARSVVALPNPAAVNTGIAVTAAATPSTSGLAKARYSLDGAPVVDLGVFSSGQVRGSIQVPAAGVYDLCVVAVDLAGNSSNPECVLLPIYDPNGGFVTGGGWINSPAGAYRKDLSAVGRATFGFVSKYKPGTSTVSGGTEFQFHAGNLHFSSTSYEWLVVSGSKAQFKGSGTIQGAAGTYKFLVTATDGALVPGGGPDKFRIRISGADGLVYDNVHYNVENPTEDIDKIDPQVISSGSIIIHK